jgi:hypothetical protein
MMFSHSLASSSGQSTLPPPSLGPSMALHFPAAAWPVKPSGNLWMGPDQVCARSSPWATRFRDTRRVCGDAPQFGLSPQPKPSLEHGLQTRGNARNQLFAKFCCQQAFCRISERGQGHFHRPAPISESMVRILCHPASPRSTPRASFPSPA